MCDVTHNKLFGLVLTDDNEAHRHIYYIINDVFVFFYQY